MATSEVQLLKDALSLVYYYDQSEGFRKEVNQKMASGGFYLGRPLFFYVQALLIFSPVYRRFYLKFTRTSAISRVKYFLRRSPPVMEQFLRSCYHEGRQEYNRLLNLTSPAGLFSSSELQTLERGERLPAGPQKAFFLSQYLANLARSKGAPVVLSPGAPPQRLTSEQINKELEKYQQVSGKEIKYVPKTHPPAPEPEAVKKLDKLVGIEPEVRQPLVSVGGEILSKVKDVAVQVEIPTQRVTARVGPALVSGGGGILKAAIGGGGRLTLGLGARGLGLVAGAATGPVGWGFLAASVLPNQGKRVAKWALMAGAALILMLVMIIFTNLFETTSILMFPATGEAAPLPTPGPGSTLGYHIPFRDSSIRVSDPETVKAEILKSWPNARLENWDTIVERSIANGWNPAFVLTLWIEESGAQGVAKYDDALGCDPDNPTTDINVSLNCVFNNFKNYTNDRFADFMCMYSESTNSPCVFRRNPYFPKNIKDWYSKLVPSGPGSIIIPTPPPVTANSCPIPGGTITCGPSEPVYTTYSACNQGHCAGDYGSPGYCTSYPSTKYAMDIGGAVRQIVYIPTITYSDATSNHSLTCKYEGSIAGLTYGSINQFRCVDDVNGKNVWLQFHHLQANFPLPVGSTVKTGESAGQIADGSAPHVHVQLGINGGCGQDVSGCVAADQYLQCNK